MCVVYLAYFTALRIGPVSIVSPVVIAYGGMTVVLAVLFRGETLTVAQAAGAVVATLGVVLAAITVDVRSLRGARIAGAGVAVAVFTLIGFAVMTVLLAGPIREHGWLPVIVGSRIGNTAGALAILAVGLRAGSSRFNPLMIPWLGWSKVAVIAVICFGLFDVTGFIAFSIGLEVAPTWLIGLASSFGRAGGGLGGRVPGRASATEPGLGGSGGARDGCGGARAGRVDGGSQVAASWSYSRLTGTTCGDLIEFPCGGRYEAARPACARRMPTWREQAHVCALRVPLAPMVWELAHLMNAGHARAGRRGEHRGERLARLLPPGGSRACRATVPADGPIRPLTRSASPAGSAGSPDPPNTPLVPRFDLRGAARCG